jgi:hypothetical protein
VGEDRAGRREAPATSSRAGEGKSKTKRVPRRSGGATSQWWWCGEGEEREEEREGKGDARKPVVWLCRWPLLPTPQWEAAAADELRGGAAAEQEPPSRPQEGTD